jgi:hypothetical protein
MRLHGQRRVLINDDDLPGNFVRRHAYMMMVRVKVNGIVDVHTRGHQDESNCQHDRRSYQSAYHFEAGTSLIGSYLDADVGKKFCKKALLIES